MGLIITIIHLMVNSVGRSKCNSWCIDIKSWNETNPPTKIGKVRANSELHLEVEGFVAEDTRAYDSTIEPRHTFLAQPGGGRARGS